MSIYFFTVNARKSLLRKNLQYIRDDFILYNANAMIIRWNLIKVLLKSYQLTQRASLFI